MLTGGLRCLLPLDILNLSGWSVGFLSCLLALIIFSGVAEIDYLVDVWCFKDDFKVLIPTWISIWSLRNNIT